MLFQHLVNIRVLYDNGVKCKLTKMHLFFVEIDCSIDYFEFIVTNIFVPPQTFVREIQKIFEFFFILKSSIILASPFATVHQKLCSRKRNKH